MSQTQCARSSRRGPRGEVGAARAAILAAARSLFFLAGDFQSVSLRAIAREAEVDTSLVSYYFGSKQSLYNEAMSLPNGPHRIIAEVCSRTDLIIWGRPWSRRSSMLGMVTLAWEDRIRKCKVWCRHFSPSLTPST